MENLVNSYGVSPCMSEKRFCGKKKMLNEININMTAYCRQLTKSWDSSGSVTNQVCLCVLVCVWMCRVTQVCVPGVIVFDQLQSCMLLWEWWKDHTHDHHVLYLLWDAGKSVFQRTMCQHMQCTDKESYRNRMNQREVEEVIKEGEQGRGGWRNKLQCYFSPFEVQPCRSVMLWDNS